MNRLNRPRVVLVTRKTNLQVLIERHGTVGQARFYVECRGQDFGEIEASHALLQEGLSQALSALGSERRRALVDRTEVDRFLFAPDDVVVVVGQDGLVPNVAKYLSGQRVIGVNPDPSRFDGVLCRHPPARLAALLDAADAGLVREEQRTMAVAVRDDGQQLLALNELYVGHRSHQSARYRLRVGPDEERQSSSGLICATGTGSTGWALSIARQRQLAIQLPTPEAPSLAWFVREPFPSKATGTALDHGVLAPLQEIAIASEMPEDGVVFADGIEADALDLCAGRTLAVRAAPTPLRLVVG
ncbi:MAG: hypothetical protein U1E65_17825 [Myxococcota bacterium]